MTKVVEGTVVDYAWTDGSQHRGTVQKWGTKWVQITNEKTQKLDWVSPDKVVSNNGVVEASAETSTEEKTPDIPMPDENPEPPVAQDGREEDGEDEEDEGEEEEAAEDNELEPESTTTSEEGKVKNLLPKDFTIDEIKVIKRAAHNTWQAIGDDIATALGKEPSKAIRIESTLDADYMLAYGYVDDQCAKMNTTWKELYTKFHKLSYTAMKKMMKDVL
jgi:hypothetical protein